MLPTSLYTLPTDDMEEGEVVESLLVNGFDPPPGVGAWCLVFPSSEGAQLRRIDRLYRVAAVAASGDPKWPWDLELESKLVGSPQRWYDIVEHLLAEGLKSVTGASGEGDRIVHPPTIAEIYRLLGL